MIQEKYENAYSSFTYLQAFDNTWQAPLAISLDSQLIYAYFQAILSKLNTEMH